MLIDIITAFCYRVSELFVDNPSGSNEVQVALNLTIPRMKCECKSNTIFQYLKTEHH